jgi:hypothetical protein
MEDLPIYKWWIIIYKWWIYQQTMFDYKRVNAYVVMHFLWVFDCYLMGRWDI